jgi:hypothetical protein
VIRTLILRGHVDGGQPLRQDTIAKWFGVSHIPVRESLRQLTAEGLVQLHVRSRRHFPGMRLRATSSAIATGSMAASSRVDCAPWASGTSPPRQPRPSRMACAERLIGSIRRECLDHIIVLGEMHLRRVLKSYAVRTHRSLNKDAPVSRPVQQIGVINSRAILGGLHHHYGASGKA